MWWKKNKWKVIVPLVIAAVLAAAFWYGGNTSDSKGFSTADETKQSQAVTQETPVSEDSEELFSSVPQSQETPSESEAISAPEEEPTPEELPVETPTASSKQPEMVIDPDTGTDQYQTDPVPEEPPLPVEPQDVTIGTNAYTCTISISCVTVLDNLEQCDPEKVELIPEGGWVLEPTTVTFYEGESVFNVLQRTCKQKKIHMEYMDTPIYNSAYIEGIHNLYEFDVGELSGWMYNVNGWFPNYGCSRYQLRDGDEICWVYTCDLGEDTGGRNILDG